MTQAYFEAQRRLDCAKGFDPLKSMPYLYDLLRKRQIIANQQIVPKNEAI